MTVDFPKLADVIKRYGLTMKKSLGQNFILDYNVLEKIAKSSVLPIKGGVVAEIGGGPGGLTRAILAQSPAHLYVIEKDSRCVQALQSINSGNLTVIEKDALDTDYAALGVDQIVANLPYNVATPLLLMWLKQMMLGTIKGITVLVQKEVAQRICAAPNTAEYGRLSVISQYISAPKMLFDLPPGVFTPPPKVTSTLIGFARRQSAGIPPCDIASLEKATAAGFAGRRKMLRQSLKQLDIDLAKTGISETLRAQNLTIGQWVAIANSLSEKGN